ncbi:MAG: enoyl-CoA hydratase/isomerase family protein [Sphingomonadales bacterium]
MSEEPEVVYEVRGKIGVIKLNRPKALNALTHSMCVSLHKKLDAWKIDDAIDAVIIMSKGTKAFCAGGDVIALYDAGSAWKSQRAPIHGWRNFFKHEYRLNSTIHHFPKPYIAIMDGITMGGGVGVSIHGSHSIATENTMLAMPETALGLFPDVGGGYFLSRLPGHTGMYLGLLGERIKAPDCCGLGITDAYIQSEKIDDLIAKLSTTSGLDNNRVSEIIRCFSSEPGPSTIMGKLDEINEVYSLVDVNEILKSLKKIGSKWSIKQHESLMKKSPMSLNVTFQQIRRGAFLTFDKNMIMEYKIVNRIMRGDDFYEGVRAILIDKDFKPRWSPLTLDNVTPEETQAHFVSMEELDLSFDNENHNYIDD